MPIDYKLYGIEFKRISKILRSFGYCAYCGAKNYMPNPRTGSKVILTVHHIDNNIRNNDIENLVPLCQQCHHCANNNKTPWFNEDRYVEYKKWIEETKDMQ